MSFNNATISQWISTINHVVLAAVLSSGREAFSDTLVMKPTGWLRVRFPYCCAGLVGPSYYGPCYKRKLVDSLEGATDEQLLRWHAVMEEVEEQVADFIKFCEDNPVPKET